MVFFMIESKENSLTAVFLRARRRLALYVEVWVEVREEEWELEWPLLPFPRGFDSGL
jgi:hypothetical protein